MNVSLFQVSATLTVLLTVLQTHADDAVLGGDPKSNNAFTVEVKDDRLLISLHDQAVAQFVFRDEKILRPYFANVHTSNGLQVTRNHPPIDGTDAIDHDTWHNRDYGVFVANPFGRAAMKQGEQSVVTVRRGDAFRITFGALIHDGINIDTAAEYAEFEKRVKP